MKKLLLLIALTSTLMSVGQAQYYGSSSKDMPKIGAGRVPARASAEIGIDQNLNTIVSDDIPFVDSTGKTRTTGELFKDRPTVLLMVFYKCGGICSTELNSLTNTLRGIKKKDVGDFYDVVVVSIDPTEDYKLAARAKETYTSIYDRRGTDDGWHFMTGKDKDIRRLAKEVGFKYTRDESNGDIVHPAGLMVISPNRRITRYFLQQQYDARPVLLAIEDATKDIVGEKDNRPFFLSCVNIDPLTGKRSINIMNSVKTTGILLLIGMGAWISIMSINSKKAKMSSEGGDK